MNKKRVKPAKRGTRQWTIRSGEPRTDPHWTDAAAVILRAGGKVYMPVGTADDVLTPGCAGDPCDTRGGSDAGGRARG